MSQVLAGCRRICGDIRWRTGFSRGKPLPQTAVATCYFFLLIKHVWWLKIRMILRIQHGCEPVVQWDEYPSRENPNRMSFLRYEVQLWIIHKAFMKLIAVRYIQDFVDLPFLPRALWIPVSLVCRWSLVILYVYIKNAPQVFPWRRHCKIHEICGGNLPWKLWAI